MMAFLLFLLNLLAMFVVFAVDVLRKRQEQLR